jgi:hypothetical protein
LQAAVGFFDLNVTVRRAQQFHIQHFAHPSNLQIFNPLIVPAIEGIREPQNPR